MLTLPTKFQDELNKPINTPSFLAILAEAEGVLSNEQTLQADWNAASAVSQIDRTAQVGSVLLESAARPEQFLALSYFPLKIPSGVSPSSYYSGRAYQSFKQTTGAAKTLTAVKGFFRVEQTGGGTETLECKLFAADKTTQIGTTVTAYLTATAGEEATFNFSSQGISIANNTTYWVQFKAYYYSTYCGYVSTAGVFRKSDFYTNGQMDITTVTGTFPAQATTITTNVGDAYFQVILVGGYYKTTGYLTTQTMDMGSTPTGNGEWIIEDIKPTGTTLIYQAWASATGAFAGEETNLGAIVDGTAITNLKRYYRVKATFTSNGDQSFSPSLQSIKGVFIEGSFKTFATHPDIGYEPALMSVSALSTSIDTFKASSIGQITLTLSLCDAVSTYLATKKPKNKTVKIKAGFIADGFTEADYIDYFWGQIDAWNITAKDEVVITVKDFSKEWSVDVPDVTTAGIPVTIWQGHPVDAMLDILKNHINVRDSKIDGASFGSVKEALSGWFVFRTLKEDTVQGSDLMEELRKLTSTYYLPQATGQIKLKRWDAAEASVAAFTDADFITKRWDSSAKQMVNRVVHYYGWDGKGDDVGDYNKITKALDPVSQIDWAEVKSQEIKDKWTPTTQTAQSSDYTGKILLRYANPPSTLIVDVDLRHIALEVGDMVTVTTYRAPSTDMSGIANIKFQIINKNLNFAKNTLSLTLLESHSSVNTQVEPPAVQPTPYDLPDHVVGLVIVEQQFTNRDGSYTPIITVTYTLPTNNTYWDHAIIQTSIDSGATFQDYGLDYLSGNGFLIDAKRIGGYVGGTLEVKVISVNTQGIAAPYATAPTRSIVKVGTPVITKPDAIRGLAIEGNPDPNNTQWDGLRFALTWWKASQTGGAGVEGGLGAGGFVDPYWNGDEYELWVSGTCIDSGMTKEARYDYIYGDGYLAYLDDKIAAANGTVTFKVRRVSLNLASEWSTITITQAAPANPAGLTGTGMSRSVLFTWNMSAETDFDYYSIRTKIGSGGAWSGWSSISGNSYLRTFTQAELTGGSLTVYIEIKAVDLYGNMSGAASTNAATWMIVPDELYTTLRTDFWVRDSIFYFNVATLTWTVGSITRAAETFTLAASTLASANNKYVIATLSGGVATLSLADMTAGIPALNANQIIIATTSYAPNTAGNYLCFIRQANSMMIEGAIIRDATITAASIANATITGAKIASATITDANITLATITAASIANATITGAKIASATITAANIVDATITDAKIASATITAASIANATITGAKIASATITNANIADLAAGKITAGTITGSTLQTASSGKRFVVSSSDNEAHFYNASNVEMVHLGEASSDGWGLASHGFFNASGTETGIMALSSGTYGRAIQARKGDGGIAVELLANSATGGAYEGVSLYCRSTGRVSYPSGAFSYAETPLRLEPGPNAGAPTHTAFKGSLWVDSGGVLYINTSDSTTWAKVGAQ